MTPAEMRERDEAPAALDLDAVEARALLDGVRAALGPTCADATHEALPGLVREVVQCDGATHERCDEQRDEIAALRGEVERLEGRRGALLAEIDRLRGVVATARAEGAREMREAAASQADRAVGSGACTLVAGLIRALPLPERGDASEIDRLRSAAADVVAASAAYSAAVQRELVNDDRSALLSHAEQVCHAQAKLALAHRTTPPTEAEIRYHAASGGWWLVTYANGSCDATVITMVSSRAWHEARGVTWWLPLTNGRPCAWPTVTT
jgi:hypothetical protein